MLGRAFGDEQALRRFQREARAAARLNHPRIVSVFDYGGLEGQGMAPEQLTRVEVDQRADIFALGVLLVEVLTGSRPFRGGTYAELLESVMIETYHLPGSSPEILELDALLQRCLAKQSVDRVGSVSALRPELIAALQRCPALRPITRAVSPDAKTS